MKRIIFFLTVLGMLMLSTAYAETTVDGVAVGGGSGDFLADGSVPMTAPLFIDEQAAAAADQVGKGQIWVKTATPNQLWFTDAGGTDHRLGTGSGDLLADGTVPLTANWDVGAFTIRALGFVSDVATGTAPFTVASTTEVANLHAATATLATTATTANAGDSATAFFSSGTIEDARLPATISSDITGQAATVATITGLAPDTATTAATQANITTAANLVTVGALDSGSITSGFGSINIGADDFTTTGTVYAGAFEADASALPNLSFNDTNMPGADKLVGNIYSNYLSGAEDAEESGMYFQIKDGGSDTTVLTLTGELAAVTGALTTSSTITATGAITPSGGIKSLTPVIDAAADFAANFTGANLYGGTFICDTTGTIQLPAIGAGMNFTIITKGDIAVVVEPNASDLFWLDGVPLDDADSATNLSTSGDIIVFQYMDATGWIATSNGWTDED
jgi:hypothetical protein